MRALYLPDLYTSTELTGISCIGLGLGLFEALQTIDPPEFAVFSLPRAKAEYTWSDEAFAKPWIEPRMVAQDRWYMQPFPAHEPQWLEDLLPKRTKAPLIDYALTFRYAHGGQVAAAFHVPQSKWSWTPEIPVVSWVPEMMELDGRPAVTERVVHWMMLASAQAGALVMLSEKDRGEWLDVFESMVRPDEFERLRQRVFTVNPAADFRAVDARFEQYEAERRQRRADGGDVVLFSGGSFESARNLPPMVQAVERLRAAGVPIVGKLFGPRPGKQGPGGRSKRPPESWAVTAEEGIDHGEYVARLGEADLFWAGFTHTATALALNEGIRSGMLPVWLYHDWMDPWLIDRYPLVARTVDDLEYVLRFAVEHVDDLRDEWVPRYRERLDAWGPQQVALRWRQTMETVLAGPRARNLLAARHLNPMFDLLPKAIENEGWTEVTDAQTVHKAFARLTRTGIDLRHTSPTMLRWMFMALGWKDRCDRPGLSMVKEA